MLDGRSFKSFGPAMEKARSPMTRLELGTTQSSCSLDLSVLIMSLKRPLLTYRRWANVGNRLADRSWQYCVIQYHHMLANVGTTLGQRLPSIGNFTLNQTKSTYNIKILIFKLLNYALWCAIWNIFIDFFPLAQRWPDNVLPTLGPWAKLCWPNIVVHIGPMLDQHLLASRDCSFRC
jgi:hypothetical protein